MKVFMQHPDIDADPAETTEAAFVSVWEDKGWKRVSEAQAQKIVTERKRRETTAKVKAPASRKGR